MINRTGLVVLFVTALTMIGNLGTNLYGPSMPAMALELHTTAGAVQLTMTTFLLAFGLSQLVVGPLSDRYGRRRVLLVGLAVFVAASVGCAFTESIGSLIAWRVLQAIGACSGQVIARAIVRDLFSRDETARIMTYVGMAISISPATGPLIGGYLHEWFGWHANFILLAVLGAVLLAVSFAYLAETNRYMTRGGSFLSTFAGFGTLIRSARFLGYVFTASCTLAAVMAYTVSTPFIVIGTLGYSPEQYGWFLSALVLGYLPGGYVMSRVGGRLGIDGGLATGIAICAISAVAGAALVLAGSVTLIGLFVPVFVFSFGMAFIFPNSMAGAVGAYPRIAGTASAFLGFSHMTTAGVTTAIVGALNDGTAEPMAWFLGGMTLLGAVAFWVLVWRRRPS